MGTVAGLCPSKMEAPRREPYRRQYSVTCQRTGINALLWHLPPNARGTLATAPCNLDMNPETITIDVRHYNKPYGLVKNTGAETEPR